MQATGFLRLPRYAGARRGQDRPSGGALHLDRTCAPANRASGGGTPCKQRHDGLVWSGRNTELGLDDFIRGVDDLPHRRRELQEGEKPLPRVPPHPHRGRVLLAPDGPFEDVQLLGGGRLRRGGVDRPQPGGDGLAVTVGDEPHRRPNQMHHTCLHDRVRPGGLDRLREAGQAVAAGDQHISDAPVGELGAHPGPELGALAGLDPDAEDMLDPVAVDADRDVGGLVPDGVGVLHQHLQRVKIQDRIHGSNGRVCHAFTSSTTASVMLEIVSWLSWVPSVRSRWA
jgi:hypothetical protein